jgi:ATP-binding cassette subfamily F protein uup
VRLGANLQMVTLDQRRESLDPAIPLAETLTGGRGDTVSVAGQPRHVIGYMKDFLFAAEQARTPLGKLSGGERGRLMLAQALAKPSNLLVLDEPTNDLDMETLDVLEDVLGDYPGTVLLISHDRDFLDRLVSGVIVPEGDGQWAEYAGGYSDMLAQRGADLSRKALKETQKADTPKPVKAPVNTGTPAAKQRMSFKHKHALETLPKTIATLQAKASDLQEKLSDPKFYQRDRDGFEKATKDLGETHRKLAAAEEEWLELEMMREEMAGG